MRKIITLMVMTALIAAVLWVFKGGLGGRARALTWEDQLEKKILPSPELTELGKEAFGKLCVVCHGENGNGRGKGARYFLTKPRDFTLGVFKVRSTPSGSLPIDEDLFRTISAGFPAYNMPSFKYLNSKERWALVYYLKGFSSDFKEELPEEPLIIGKMPPPTAQSIQRGRELYKLVKCWECHGKNGRGDGPAMPTLKDDKGRPIMPMDFTKGERHFKRGARAEDIMFTFLTGMDGTPMPSYKDTLSIKQAWDLSLFVESLTK